MKKQAQSSVFARAWSAVGALTGLAHAPLAAAVPAPQTKSARTYVIAFASSKGGPGKTTSCVQLAAVWRATGNSVLIIDADTRQASASTWGAARVRNFGDHPDFVTVRASEVNSPRLIEDARRRGWRLVLVDLPGTATPAVIQTVKQADLTLILARPTAFDIRSAAATTISLKNLGRKHRILLSQAPALPNRVAAARKRLEAFAPVLPTAIGNRVAYVDSIARGQGVIDFIPGGEAASEIKSLAQDIVGILAPRRKTP